MHLVQVTPPSAEPITLAEARLHLKVDVGAGGTSADDSLIQSWITSARIEAETWTERSIPAQTWLLTLDRFPLYDGSGPRVGSDLGVGAWEFLEPRRIRLPRPPLVQVNSLTYYDFNQTLQTVKIGTLAELAADDTILAIWSTAREPGTIEPAYGQTWPIALYQADSISVNYTAGWPCTTIAGAVSTGAQTVTPASMAGIIVGTILTIDVGPLREMVTVTAVSSTTFTATFANAHAATTPPTICRAVPENLISAMLIMIGWNYRDRDPQPSERDRVESLLWQGHCGAYP